ncbi:MAG: insulinase family protein, partial [Phycisphaerales bacterium]|nr:insulinase family protein [Phycisphaerales bacterium]
DDVNREFDEIGANYNAYTASELTCFHANVLPEHLDTATDILGDILRPALRQDDFDTEKSVILEEIAMYKDHPFWVLYERAMEEYYGDHPLAHRVLGTDQSITDLTRDQMQTYFDARYSSDNTVVALAGRLNFRKCVEQINQLCGGWKRTGARRDGARPTPRDRDFTIHDERVSRAYLLQVSPGPSIQDENRYAAMMLAKVLGDPGNSRLHWSLIETGIAEDCQAAYDPRDGCGDFYIYASGEPDRTQEIWRLVQKEVDGLVDSLTADDLELLRNRLATSVTLAGERPGGRMQRLGRLWTYLGEYTPLEEELARINAVTLDGLRDVFRQYPFSPRTLGRLLPAE